jgi:hypothetical protein
VPPTVWRGFPPSAASAVVECVSAQMFFSGS